MVISGRQLREEILSHGPAFLHPEDYSEPDAFRALVTILAAYSLGSRTAARLVRERQAADETWQPPSRREAMQVVSSLNRLRQYLPYLLGERLQAGAAGPASERPHRQTAPGVDRPATESRATRPIVQIAPAPRPSRPVVTTRPPPTKAPAVVVRPVISIDRK